MAKLPLDKMAAQLEDIANDITGDYERRKVYPWDRIADATATIAEAVGAEVPDKKYSTKKAQVADTINAIAEADVSGGGGDSGVKIKWCTLFPSTTEFTFTSSNADITSNTINVPYDAMPESGLAFLSLLDFISKNSPLIKIIVDDEEMILPVATKTALATGAGSTPRQTIVYGCGPNGNMYNYTIEGHTIEATIKLYDDGEDRWYTLDLAEHVTDGNFTPWFGWDGTKSGITILVGSLDA